MATGQADTTVDAIVGPVKGGTVVLGCIVFEPFATVGDKGEG